MSQSDDDEEKETLQKRQRRQEDTTMKGNINPQHATKLLTKQHHKHERQKEKYVSPKYNSRP